MIIIETTIKKAVGAFSISYITGLYGDDLYGVLSLHTTPSLMSLSLIIR
jgi:hypothetical protein